MSTPSVPERDPFVASCYNFSQEALEDLGDEQHPGDVSEKTLKVWLDTARFLNARLPTGVGLYGTKWEVHEVGELRLAYRNISECVSKIERTEFKGGDKAIEAMQDLEHKLQDEVSGTFQGAQKHIHIHSSAIEAELLQSRLQHLQGDLKKQKAAKKELEDPAKLEEYKKRVRTGQWARRFGLLLGPVSAVFGIVTIIVAGLFLLNPIGVIAGITLVLSGLTFGVVCSSYEADTSSAERFLQIPDQIPATERKIEIVKAQIAALSSK